MADNDSPLRLARFGSVARGVSELRCGRTDWALGIQGQPHVVVDLGNPQLWIYHRLGGTWTEALFAQQSEQTDAGRIYVPHLEIDALDRGWISAWVGVKDGGSMAGQGVWLVDRIATEPEARFVGLANEGFKNGNLGLDPAAPGEAVVMTKAGRWQRWNEAGDVIEVGDLDLGASGEKIRFLVRPREGEVGVWHVVMSGYSVESSSYRNSLMAEPVTWAAYDSYSDMGEDMLHPGLGLDGLDPAVGYMAIGYDAGLVLNVWDGQALLFDSGALPVLDPEPAQHGNGGERFGPQWAPASFGGAFMCWTGGDGTIRLLHVDATGTRGDPVEITAGSSCTLAADPQGNLHMAYVNGGLRYRHIALVSGT